MQFTTPTKAENCRHRVVVISILVWAIALVFGIRALLVYARTPGTPATPPARWPPTAPVRTAGNRASLLAFIHPQCSCSRATLTELEQILLCCRNQVEATVFLYEPSRPPEGWDSDLSHAAAAIPGARFVADTDAVAARLFGVQVSGQVLLYGSTGQLIFAGGITPFRGHVGDNYGLEAITRILNNQPPRHQTTPVFGCALYGEELGQR